MTPEEERMKRHELADKIASRIEQEFDGTKVRPDGARRKALDAEDCRYIVNVVLSEIGQSDLGIYDVGK